MTGKPNLMIWASLIVMIISVRSYGDMGAIVPESDVTVDEPGQKAIIAHDGMEEVLILSTDLNASKKTKALRFIPFPSEPDVSLAPKNCFEKLGEILKLHNVKYLVQKKTRGGGSSLGPPVEVRFQKRLGAHDLTVVKISDASHFQKWVRRYFKKKKLPVRNLTKEETSLVADYVSRGFKYFAFDLINLSGGKDSIAPLVYRFESPEHVYYPLQTSNLFGGSKPVELFVFSDRGQVHNEMRHTAHQDTAATNHAKPNFHWSMTSSSAFVNAEEMRSISPQIAELMGANALLCAYKNNGSKSFTTDIFLKTPLLVFGPVSKKTYKTVSEEKPHTPQRGSSERTAILNSLRDHYGRPGNKRVIFVVRHLKVKRGWAWIHALPRDEDGKNQYEDVLALLTSADGNWKVVGVSGGAEENPSFKEDIRKWKKTNPDIPDDIFY